MRCARVEAYFGRAGHPAEAVGVQQEAESPAWDAYTGIYLYPIILSSFTINKTQPLVLDISNQKY